MNRPETKVRRPQLLCIIGCEGANIKKKEQVELILNQIDIEDIKTAIARAELITSNNLAKEVNKTPQEHEYFDNPDTQMHNMLKSIFQKVGVIKTFGL